MQHTTEIGIAVLTNIIVSDIDQYGTISNLQSAVVIWIDGCLIKIKVQDESLLPLHFLVIKHYTTQIIHIVSSYESRRGSKNKTEPSRVEIT